MMEGICDSTRSNLMTTLLVNITINPDDERETEPGRQGDKYELVLINNSHRDITVICHVFCYIKQTNMLHFFFLSFVLIAQSICLKSSSQAF